jgi:7-cyano-7-deazaguanine synthase
MLSVAAGIAYTSQTYNIVGGWNAVDYVGYPDCRETFLEAMEGALNHALGTTRGINHLHIHSPLIHLSKSEIISYGIALKVPFELTWSCYSGGDTPCGVCDSCKIRQEGFATVGVEDPALQNT